MSRKRITAKERLHIFVENDGICHMCGGSIDAVREAWEVSHPTPLELGGADNNTNRKPAHKKCHAVQTRTIDVPRIAKARRREAIHLGAKTPTARPVFGSKASGWRKPFNGPAERRT